MPNSSCYSNLYPRKFIHQIIEQTALKFYKVKEFEMPTVLPMFIPYVRGLFEKSKSAFKDDPMLVDKSDNCVKNTVLVTLKTKLQSCYSLIFSIKSLVNDVVFYLLEKLYNILKNLENMSAIVKRC